MRPPVKPARLKEGDTVGLVMPPFAQRVSCPARHPAPDPRRARAQGQGRQARLRLPRLLRGARRGLGVSICNATFADSGVTAIHRVRGGCGAARLLPLLDPGDHRPQPQDPRRVQRHHGAAAVDSRQDRPGHVSRPGWGVDVERLHMDWMKKVLWNAEAAVFANAKEANDTPVPVKNRNARHHARPGARRLLGGNLTGSSPPSSGSGSLPDQARHLRLEDVEEAPTASRTGRPPELEGAASRSGARRCVGHLRRVRAPAQGFRCRSIPRSRTTTSKRSASRHTRARRSAMSIASSRCRWGSRSTRRRRRHDHHVLESAVA